MATTRNLPVSSLNSGAPAEPLALDNPYFTTAELAVAKETQNSTSDSSSPSKLNIATHQLIMFYGLSLLASIWETMHK